MPRVRLQGFSALSAPVSITAAAKIIGTTPATLRTWEKRYGVGPSHPVGSARKYSPTDILILRRMRSLRQKGVPPADAALYALEEIPKDFADSAVRSASSADLALAATNGELNAVRMLLANQIYLNGLVRTYCDFVEPAFRQLAQRSAGDLPGRDPYVLIERVIMDAVYEIYEQAPSLSSDCQNALIVVGPERFTAGHVIASALYWNGIDSRVMVKEADCLNAAIMDHLTSRNLDYVILIDEENQSEAILRQLLADNIQLICVAQNPPSIINSHVSWIRSLRAVVAELQNMM